MLADSSLTEMKTEKAIYHADLNQGYEAKGDSNDIDIPYYETNERYDQKNNLVRVKNFGNKHSYIHLSLKTKYPLWYVVIGFYSQLRLLYVV